MYGRHCATYETAATRKYYHGRTETVRSCTTESCKWVKAMLDPTKSDKERALLLKDAVVSHYEYMSSKHGRLRDCCFLTWAGASNGYGVDRHLMGLKILSMLHKIPHPFFASKCYTLSSSYELSTSNIGSTDVWGGFSSTHPQGYGACYAIRSNCITVSIASYRECKFTDSAMFGRAVEESFLQLRSLLKKAGQWQARM